MIDQNSNDLYIVNNQANIKTNGQGMIWLFAYANFLPGTNPTPLRAAIPSLAPGALAIAPALGSTLLVANGPTSGPSTIDLYYTLKGAQVYKKLPLTSEPGGDPGNQDFPSDPDWTGPTGMAVDPNSGLVIAISYYYTGNVLFWSPLVQQPIVMSAQTYFNTNPQPYIGRPEGVAIDKSGNLFVSDTLYRAINVFDTNQTAGGSTLLPRVTGVISTYTQ